MGPTEQDTLDVMSDDGVAWREGTGAARMSGSGSREGFGSPPWDPADPVPELEDTQALPGLGAPGTRKQNGQGTGQDPVPGPSADGASDTPQADDGTAAEDGEDTGEQQEGQPGRKRPRRRRSLLRELPVLVVVALVLALVIKTYAIQAFYIPSSSMENTLDIGDRVLINKLVYDFRGIHRGDIVVFDGNGSWDFSPPASSNFFSRAFADLEGIVGISHDSDIYIKRVVGLPGDHVACCDTHGRVTVNGVALNEGSYVYPGEAPSLQRFNITVPPGRLWVMGDHRLVSYDSRGHMGDPGGGTIPESAVLGRAFVIIWPPSRWGFLNIPATFEQPKLNASAAAAGGSATALAMAMDNGTPLQSSTSPLPLALGFAGALPLTWLQSKARRKLRAKRTRRH
jgi:signal peptidase I